MSKALKTEAARGDRRTRAAVATVAPTSAGTAACRTERDLFDQADSARAPLTVRIKAAATCATCPFTDTCGFRVAMPRVSSCAQARSLYRNRAT
ncbi:hypothetical protein Stsp01_64490 [Streptomyces sp. NBRC 13847]|uniref:hypothetical protein n=1 Tax=Streptomyces TaxID=1883 RepID=UPI0024A23079|nr:hypothetical protein [Streptomyces sp. NBRC 13847]GLW19706.1 hypothetical protein Stsp01_64490 [Streptomyces sp. NBRC 13847]